MTGQLALPGADKERREAFGRIVAFVAAGFPSAVNIDAATIATYYRMLDGVPLDIIKAVGERILESEEFDHFPPCPRWLKMAHQIAAEKQQWQHQRLLQSGVDRGFGPEFYCSNCDDSGWKVFSKETREHVTDWQQILALGHAGRYVEACECRPDNPVYKKNHPPAPPKFKRKEKTHGKEARSTPGRPRRYEPEDDE